MPILNNTIGGHYEYEQYGKTVAYTFPSHAYIELDGIKISLANIRVQTYGGKYDEESALFFAETIGKVPTQSPHHCSSNIFISDFKISDDGFPAIEDFEKYHIPYISLTEFSELQVQATPFRNEPHHPTILSLTKLIDFFEQYRRDNRQNIKHAIQKLLSENTY